MPEATAIKPLPASPDLAGSELKPSVGDIQYSDDHLPSLYKGVTANLKQAGIPISDLTLSPAPHLPVFKGEAVVDKRIVDASGIEPESYKKMEFPGPDIVRQHVTGDTTVVGDSKVLHEVKRSMGDEKVEFLNQGQSRKKTWKDALGWFYDEDKKAA